MYITLLSASVTTKEISYSRPISKYHKSPLILIYKLDGSTTWIRADGGLRALNNFTSEKREIIFLISP